MNRMRALGAVFSEKISWIKASPSCRYRFEVLGIGEFRSGFNITAHAHAFYEFGLGLEGAGDLLVGQQRQVVRKGGLYVIEPGVTHRLAASNRDDFHAFIFTVASETVEPDSPSPPIPGVETSRTLQSRGLVDLMDTWLDVVQERSVDPLSLSLFARFLAFEILAILANGRGSKSWPVIDRARQCIEERLPGKVDANAIAATLGISDRTLRRHFQMELGKSVIEYVNERRLALAERHLALHLSVADAAGLVGFESASQLSRLFQKTKGMTPKHWQQTLAPTRRMPKTNP